MKNKIFKCEVTKEQLDLIKEILSMMFSEKYQQNTIKDLKKSTKVEIIGTLSSKNN